MRKFLSILMVLALVTALFVSCSQDNVGSVVGEDLVSISFATGDNSRTLTVSREAFDENDYIWCYTAVKADNSGMTQGQTTEEQYVWGDDHTKTGLTGATIEGISQGLWNFTLSAYVPVSAGGEKSAVKAWAGSVTNQPVKKGEANVVNVTVSAVVDPEKDGMITFQNVVVRKLNGSDVTAPAIWTGYKDLILGVKATTLAGAAVDGAFVEYKKGEGHTTSNIPEPKFEVAAGTYFVTFKAYEGTFAEPTFVYAEETIAVNVYSGLSTIISGFVSELSSFVQFGEPVANAVIEASTSSVKDVTTGSVDFNTDPSQSTSSYQAASIPGEAVEGIQDNVTVPSGSTLTDLTLSLNVQDKGSADASGTTTKSFDISLDAIVTTTDSATGSVSVEPQAIHSISELMTVKLYIGKNLGTLVVKHGTATMPEGVQTGDAEYYEYDSSTGILTLHVKSFSPFSVAYAQKAAVARLSSTDGTGSDFYTLGEAVAAAQNGNTITLLKDVAESFTVNGKDITLVINGKKLTGGDMWVEGNATLTVDGTAEGSLVYGCFCIGKSDNNNGNIVINGGEYECGNNDTCLHINGTCMNSNVTIKNAKITSPTDNGIQLNGKGTFLLENCMITGATAVYVKSGELTINGGTYTGTMAPADYSYYGNGSNATGDAIVIDSCEYPGGAPTVIINAGTFNGTKGAIGYYRYDGNKDGILTGATINGKYDPIAMIGTVAYSTFPEACIDALNTEGDTVVTIIRDGKGDGYSDDNGPKGSYTIDFAGHTYDVTGLVGSTGYASQAFRVINGQTVTLKNGTLTSSVARMLINQYGNLTLDDMVLDGSKLDGTGRYTLSNNMGKTTITGNTQIIAKADGFAFDVYGTYKYDDPDNPVGIAVITDKDFTGSVSGVIEYVASTTNRTVTLTIEAGDFKGATMTVSGLDPEKQNSFVSIEGGVFGFEPANEWLGSGYEKEQVEGGYWTVHPASN